MVNTASTRDRRERERAPAAHAPSLGSANLNPFGDLHILQHLSARFARSLRGVCEPLLRRGLRSWAEPVEVARFGDYRAERGQALTAWAALEMASGEQALLVVDGRFVLEALDLFFGGVGDTPATLPTEFTPAAEAMVRRLATMLAGPLATAWEPVARMSFAVGTVEANAALLQSVDGEDPVVISRFGLASGEATPTFVDILYPVSALKPHAPSLNAKVHGRSAEADPKWLSGLTRAAMGVRMPVRSVLAEPVISIGRLLDLREGDVIPISFGPQVPVMVGGRRLGMGTVGTANGKAAIRLTSLHLDPEEDYR